LSHGDVTKISLKLVTFLGFPPGHASHPGRDDPKADERKAAADVEEIEREGRKYFRRDGRAAAPRSGASPCASSTVGAPAAAAMAPRSA
jgi:hypothetical protein